MRKPHFIYLLVFVSGFAGLIYEIVWTRQLTLLFGVSIYAVSAVIAVFLLGLAAGSYLFGRRVDRGGDPLRIFATLELLVAAYALALPLIAKFIEPVYLALYDYDFPRPAIFFLRFILTLVLLIFPTLLMGGTLPVAGKLCSRSFDRFGSAVAKLYGLNTLGAVLGAGVAGFFLLRWFGVSGSTYVAVTCNAMVGVVALWMSRYASADLPNVSAGIKDRPKTKKKKFPVESGDPATRRKVLVVIFLSGFCALGYEVLWTKMLILMLGNSSWAFSTVLIAFLASIAIGSLVIAPWLDRRFNLTRLLSLLQILIAITAFLSLLAFRWMAVAKIGSEAMGLGEVVFKHLVRASIIMMPPTLISGAVLPLAALLCASSPAKAGTQFGLVLAFNTAGSVLGSLVAGFLLIAIFGIQNSIILLAVVNGLLGVWLLHIKVPQMPEIGTVKMGIAMLVVLALISTLYLTKPPLTLPLPGYELRYYEEDAAGIISILEERSEGTKIFNINNVNEVTTHESSLITFRLMAYLPYLLHEDPREALVITFGAGIVAGSLAQLDLNRLDCVEINPNARTVGQFFAAENHNVVSNPKLNLFIEDGRNFLSTTSQEYDILTADATHPTGADSWILFTKEYYELCRQRLKKGGLFLQWLPLHALSENYYLTILATAAEVFDELEVWFTGLDVPIGHTVMIGRIDPLSVDFEQVREKMDLSVIRSDLAKMGIHSPESLLSHFLTNKKGLRPILEGRALNTDDMAITAFPDGLPSQGRWATNLSRLVEVQTNPSISNVSASRLQSFEAMNRVSGWLIHAALRASAGDFERAAAWINRIAGADVELEELGSAFSTTAERVIASFLDESERAISATDTSRALFYLEKAQIVSAAVPKSYLRLSELCKKMGQFERALTIMKQATEVAPSSESFFELGMVAQEMGELQQAMTAYQAALRQRPDLASALTNLGIVYARIGEPQKARQAWKNALKYNPDDELAQRSLSGLEKMSKD